MLYERDWKAAKKVSMASLQSWHGAAESASLIKQTNKSKPIHDREELRILLLTDQETEPQKRIVYLLVHQHLHPLLAEAGC